MDNMKKILVLSRLTKHCKKAVNYGLFLAEKCDAELYILHVIHNPFGLEGWNLPTSTLEEEYSKVQKQAKADLDKLVAANKPEGVQVQIILREGDPNEELFEIIEQNNIDLLIFTGHSEWRLEHFILGKSNDEIIRKLPCSVLMVKDEPHAVNF
jgi:universal stress protein A